jgi:hypothetical protein
MLRNLESAESEDLEASIERNRQQTLDEAPNSVAAPQRYISTFNDE